MAHLFRISTPDASSQFASIRRRGARVTAAMSAGPPACSTATGADGSAAPQRPYWVPVGPHRAIPEHGLSQLAYILLRTLSFSPRCRGDRQDGFAVQSAAELIVFADVNRDSRSPASERSASSGLRP